VCSGKEKRVNWEDKTMKKSVLFLCLFLLGCSPYSKDIETVKKMTPYISFNDKATMAEAMNNVAGINGSVAWSAFKEKEDTKDQVRIKIIITTLTKKGTPRMAELVYLFNRNTKKLEQQSVSIDGKEKPMLIGNIELSFLQTAEPAKKK
jgi:hypothetical protein